MADVKPIDPLVSTEEPIDVDAETAAAIERGIGAAEEGRTVTSEEARKLASQWFSRFSTQTPR
jgi:predicted transcriptional regulator